MGAVLVCEKNVIDFNKGTEQALVHVTSPAALPRLRIFSPLSPLMVFKDFLLTDLLIRSLSHHSYGNVSVRVCSSVLVALRFEVLKSKGKKIEESISPSFPLSKISVK